MYMLGFQEPEHTTVANQTIVRKGTAMQLERRRPINSQRLLTPEQLAQLRPDSQELYRAQLAIQAEVREYLVLLDPEEPHYFFYGYGFAHTGIPLDEAVSRLSRDWETLTVNPDTEISKLHWCEWVYADVAHSDRGDIAMY
jgi:hypothetical protein